MKKIAFATLVSAGLALAACGSSESANEAAQPDTVELPAEEAIADVDASATPVVDAAATATSVPEPAASDAAAAPGAATGTPAASPAAAPATPAKQ